MADQGGNFLPALTTAFKTLDAGSHIYTKEFADAVEKILPIFDTLGTVFHFAKHELNVKRESLVKVAGSLETLDAVIEADRKAGKLTTKDSCARNLHRLLASVNFISRLLENLAADAKTTLHAAAANAYDNSLSPIHTFLVRTAVKTSMYMLPSRSNFLQSIGETEDTAKAHAGAFVPAVETLLSRIERLYGDVKMPRSNTTMLPAAAPA